MTHFSVRILTIALLLFFIGTPSLVFAQAETEMAAEDDSSKEDSSEDEATQKPAQRLYSGNHHRKLLTCNITPAYVKKSKVPKHLNKSNILRRETGIPRFAEGEKIIIAGRILDKDCVPVKGARVLIWHTDSNGLYTHSRKNRDKADKYFLGNGVTYSNNLGEYFFTTIMPGPEKDGEPPYVNISLLFKNGKRSLTSAMFFPEYDNDIGVFSDMLTATFLEEKDDERVYQFDIVVDTEAEERTY